MIFIFGLKYHLDTQLTGDVQVHAVLSNDAVFIVLHAGMGMLVSSFGNLPEVNPGVLGLV